MKILAFDISKKSTGVSFYDGEKFDGLQAITFQDSQQWEKEINEILSIWSPEVVVFSETMNRLFSQSTKRIMYGLMYHLEHLCFKKEIQVIVINDVQAKHLLGIKMNKENKEKTLEWANQFEKVTCNDISDSMSFAYYIANLEL